MKPPGTDEQRQAAEDVEDACADALLTACGLGVMLDGSPVTMERALDRVAHAIERVVNRTGRHGALTREPPPFSPN